MPVEKRGWVIYRSINCRIMNEVNRQLDECRPPHRLPLPPPFRTTPPFISLYDGANEIFIASKISMPAALSLSLSLYPMVYQSHILPPFACFGVCTHTGRDRCAHRFHDTHAPPPPPPPPRRARCIIDVRPACKRVAERRCHSIRSRFSKRQGEEREGGGG